MFSLLAISLPVSACPVVSGVSPSSGRLAGGDSVTITGTGFTGAWAVKFGATSATGYTVNSDTKITATSPAHAAGAVNITVTSAGGTSAISAADEFTYLAAPTITAISPSSGPLAGGDTVTITGTGFTTATAVKFGATSATGYIVDSDTKINATSPAGPAGTVNVTVNTAGGTSAISAADEFTYLAAPTVTAISPSSGPLAGGDTVTITGTGFTGATAVKFGSTDAAAYSIVSDTEITATSPADPAGTVDITVTTPGGTSATAPADQFTYNPPPDVTCISPTSGTTAGGTMVTICGTGFEGVTDVKFGGVSAIWFSGDTSTQVRAQPDGGAAGTVDVTVISPNGTSAVSPADQFTFVTEPMVIAATTTPVPTSTQNTSAGSDDTPGGTNVQGQAVVVAPPVTSSVDVNVGGNSAVSQVTVTGSGVGEMIVTGTVQSGPGPGMPAAPGEVYQYLTLVPARYSTITGAEIVFSVPESWFAEHTLSPGAIALNRYANSQWNTLPTRILKTENGHVFFSSASPGFSYFAIIGISRSSADVGSEEPAQEQTPVALSHNNVTQAAEKPAPAATTAAPAPPTSKAEPPVFLIVLAFIGIGGVALVAVGIVARRWWIRRQNPALFRKME